MQMAQSNLPWPRVALGFPCNQHIICHQTLNFQCQPGEPGGFWCSKCKSSGFLRHQQRRAKLRPLVTTQTPRAHCQKFPGATAGLARPHTVTHLHNIDTARIIYLKDKLRMNETCFFTSRGSFSVAFKITSWRFLKNYYSALHIGIVIFQKECTKSGHTFLIEYRILWKIPLRNIAVGGLHVMLKNAGPMAWLFRFATFFLTSTELVWGRSPHW